MTESERERPLHSLMSVFDLKIQRALRLEQGVSTRVIFLYDRDRGIHRFKVLNRNMPEGVHARITAWLEENVRDHAVVGALVANRMDGDTLNHPLAPPSPPDPVSRVVHPADEGPGGRVPREPVLDAPEAESKLPAFWDANRILIFPSRDLNVPGAN